ncbi:hypothetical protein [Diaphorobacter aerolatus]|uniref:Uncharacterized protein n=1 Tax=Diaphorobacter aerolatus TaxID=1288495 RepID=A0A7H0GJI7_9BURK|nr:hypothetical protein [Diaphorobacter aerolatus]QNP48453.1 hypothetical protein H9K75_21355 [Diaphorobacter aerolatus]
MFEHFLNPTVVYMRRIQRGLEEARMAALEHESAAEHHAALATMYRDRVRRLQGELENVTNERTAGSTVKAVRSESQPAPAELAEDAAAAAQVHRIVPRYGNKRDEASSSLNPSHGLLSQGAAG